MRIFRNVLFGFVIGSGSVSAWAVNKCVGPDGRTVFQDAPCPGKGETIVVKPASGHANPEAQSGPSVAERLDAMTAQSQAERKLIEYDHLIVPNAWQALQREERRCKEMVAFLERDKYAYVQNLYGKTHAAQRAAEIVQAQQECTQNIARLDENHKRVREEREKLKASIEAMKSK